MKKVLSLVLALCMMVSTLAVSSVAFADDTSINNHVAERLAGASAYVSASVKPTVDNAVDVLLCARANNAWGKKNIGAFVDSVKSVLASNDGKIVAYGSESIAAYGATIALMRNYGYDTKDCDGYNIEQAFLDMKYDPQDVNPYDYRSAIFGAVDEDHAKALAQELVDNYYTMGSGMNYWGYSCDNTAVFLSAIAPVADSFAAYAKDAVAVIDEYYTDKGYFYSKEYTDPNADSTGVVLAAFSAIDDMDRANKAYTTLITEFESKDNVGVMTYYGEENAYATKDGLYGIVYFAEAIHSNGHVRTVSTKAATCTADGKITKTCLVCGDVENERIEYLGHDYKEYVNNYNRCNKPDEEVRECKRCHIKQVMPLGPVKKHVMATKATKVATTKANGTLHHYCKNCGYKYDSTLYSAKSMTLSKSKFVYDGKVKKPTVTVKDSKGNKISSSNYTVTYSNNKAIGKATVKVRFKGNYSGTMSKTFTIVPKTVKLTGISTPQKGALAFKWNKVSGITGYQAQVSTSKSFDTKSTKNVNLASNRVDAKGRAISKKTYYVRVRAYKTVGKTKYYGSWSNVKSIKIK